MAVICKPDKEIVEFMRDLCESTFLDGECYAFAIALHRGLGWPILGLIIDNEIRHAVLHTIDTGRDICGDAYFDARGYLSEGELGKPFGMRLTSYQLLEIKEKDLYSARPILDNSIDKARQFAEILWPTLPWKGGTRVKKIMAFAIELEALSRKNNLWIRSPFPGSLPLLAEGCGDESYSLKIMADGCTYSVDRIIG